MNKPQGMSIALLMMSLLLFAASLFILLSDFSTNIRVDQAGGVYASSPDGRWYADIWDGFCEDNGKHYAVICLWDLEKYPALSDGITIMAGKKPEVKLVFPKEFFARGSDCGVRWVGNDAFEIEYASAGGLQVFRYDIPSQLFTLTEKDQTTEQDATADADKPGC